MFRKLTSRSRVAVRAPWLLLALLAAQAAADAVERPVYILAVQLDPAAQTLEADVRVTLDPGRAGRAVEFLLAKPLEILESQPAVEALPFDPAQGFHGINGSSSALAARGAVARYRAQLAPGESVLRLKYRGRIDFPLDTQAEEYTRGFRETPGLISPEGVYLGGSTLWYPFFGEELVSFELSSSVPQGWHLISQGNGRSRDAQGRAAWMSGGAVDEIYLVGGPLTLYSQPAGAVEAQVYLRQPDEPLARKYLAATAQYIEMYRRLIGPYPYGKFALIENFWETGYGMPSFTLLGPQIIRFPFILTSSYPHEILHNWWGNSVFVDYASGNWCEGLTAYMADHLLKEQGGQGAEFRRDALKKYRDFVKEGRDFPLTEFRSRHSAATEAVGYGKTAMGFHMLRRQLGDDAFRKALQGFYRESRGRRASFDDVRAAFEKAANRDLGVFFEQWVRRTGAPQLALRAVRSERVGERHVLRGRIVQEQKGAPYTLSVPLYVTTATGLHMETVEVRDRQGRFSFETLAEPQLVELDPEFDLFRLLDPRETSPSIGQIFGEPSIVAVLPSRAPADKLEAYRRMVTSWSNATHRIEIMSDASLQNLPAGRAAWVLGRENLLAAPLFGRDAAPGLEVAGDGLRAGGTAIPFAGHSAVIVRRHPGDVTKAIGWLVLDPLTAAEGLARKLLHYGKYSWLGFAGSEPAIRAKGEWPTSDSPLRVDLRAESARVAAVASAARPKREPLAGLPPTFAAAALRSHVAWLAAPGRDGRGVGTPGLDAAADYLAQQFAAAGLAPGGADGAYFQPFRLPAGPDGKPVEVRNVIGVLRPAGGSGAQGANASTVPAARDVVLVTAHYDHLGYGWPGVRAGEEGRIHPGADDNASGVAVLIELARAYAAAGTPQRPIVFLASSAEEAGLRGSRYFLEHPTPFARERLRAAVNIDTAGRLGAQEIQALATGSASEWPHIFRGVGFTTGIPVKSIEGAAESSDQLAFIERGIPAVQIFTGAHLDYHRPSDTAEKIDAEGLVKVATVVKEAVDYLLGRAEPLTATIAPHAGAPTASAPTRRAALGTVPDFAFPGPGVRVESVVPDSPAAAAGIVAGDVLTSMDGQAIANLQSYSDLLKAHAPGAVVAVQILRGAERIETSVTLAAR